MSDSRVIVVVGSSRVEGETEHFVDELLERTGWDSVDLNDYSFSYFDYVHKNRDDDFIPLMRRIIEEYDTIVFATPVYWYAMSGIMKVFFDRITDLLTIEKDLGRRLRGKAMAAISSSYGNNLGEVFWLPFSETAAYLGMKFLGGLHTVVEKKHQEELEKFIQAVDYKGLKAKN